MYRGERISTHKQIERACNDEKYILIIKRPHSTSRIHKGTCYPLRESHCVNHDILDYELGTSGARQIYFAFDSLEDADNACSTHTANDAVMHCARCIRE